jgi:formate hydrogenlyase subunit 3/multisubunit Na+/H+ antiporter MnhD subunit
MFYLTFCLSFSIPVISGCLFFVIGDRLCLRARNYCVTAVCALSAAAAIITSFGGEFAITQPEVMPGLAADGLSHLFAVLTASIWFIIAVYIAGLHGGTHNVRFISLFLIIPGILILLYYSADAITMTALFVLTAAITAAAQFIRTRAAAKAAAYTALCAAAAVAGIVIIRAAGLPSALSEDLKKTACAGVMLTVIGFGGAAGMFPFSMPAGSVFAPDPVSALITAVAANAGILCLIRTAFFSAGAGLLRGTWVQYTWAVLAAVTLLTCAVSAYKEKEIYKKLLRLSSGQTAYTLLGLALMNESGVNGALLHIIYNTVIMAGLFMAAPQSEAEGGSPLSEGSAAPNGAADWCFAILSFSLTGIPPAAGFISRWYIVSGALDSLYDAFTWLVPAVIFLGTLYNAVCLSKLTLGFFLNKNSGEGTSVSALMPVFFLTALSVLTGIYVEPFYEAVKNLIL